MRYLWDQVNTLEIFFYYQDTQRTLKKYIISKLLTVWWYLEKGPLPLIVSFKLYDIQQLGIKIKKQKNKYKLLLIKYSDIVKTRWQKKFLQLYFKKPLFQHNISLSSNQINHLDIKKVHWPTLIYYELKKKHLDESCFSRTDVLKNILFLVNITNASFFHIISVFKHMQLKPVKICYTLSSIINM